MAYPAGSWMFSGWWYVQRFSTASRSWIRSTFRTSKSVEQETKCSYFPIIIYLMSKDQNMNEKFLLLCTEVLIKCPNVLWLEQPERILTRTVGLNCSGSLDQVICELHGVCRAHGQITRQPDNQDAHQRVFKQRHFRTKAKEETEEQEEEEKSAQVKLKK